MILARTLELAQPITPLTSPRMRAVILCADLHRGGYYLALINTRFLEH